MEVEWSQVWEIFPLSVVAALLAGLVCPQVGNFLFLRRTGFYGVALPQFAACGVAFGFAIMPWWVTHVGIGGLDLETALEDTHAAVNYHMAWAGVFTFGGLGVLYLLGQRPGSEAARIAAAFALASAGTILFAHASPTGEIFVHELLRGSILVIGLHEFETLAVAFGFVALAMWWFQRGLLLVSFDPDTARVLGLGVRRYEALLVVLIGLTVTIGSLTVGPVVLFALLVLPPLAASHLARSLRSFRWISSLIGLGAAALGLQLSFAFDLPLGPTIVVGAGILLSLSLLPFLGLRKSST